MPKRIQRKRTKGWRMPEGAVYVGRPTKWGNPFRVIPGETNGSTLAVGRYRRWLEEVKFRGFFPHRVPSQVGELRGKDLACWCSLDQPCHADVLLEIANPVAQETERGR